MAVQETPRTRHVIPVTEMQVPTQRAADTAPEHGAVMTTLAAKFFAVLRISTGVVFLWAFLDKMFGLGYATQSANAWVNGGSPTNGFLSRVSVGPLESTFQSMAGAVWADWLFMLGLLGIGVALLAGVALRITAAAGGLMMAMMWAAEWPLARYLSDGSPSMSTNPVMEYHVIYALVLIALAVSYAGNTWGLGRRWAEIPFVRRNRWLL
ncbi:DoxX family membrane protein [Streptomyces sodiiphilus]|uniref:DoxX family membrane protein n=1 Tax=Streptomyces sodiiphilus TaxID=226217 RepID=A0ABP5AHH8_9ACTN